MDWISGIFMTIGAFFMLIAGLGLIRFPDIYTRMHAVSKAMSLGIGSMLLATMIEFATWSVSLKGLLILIFLFLTIPVASQILSYVAYLMKVPLWEKSLIDEYADN